LAGSYDTPGDVSGVIVSGNHAYVADNSSRIPVLDISDPANIALVTTYETSGASKDLALADGFLYSASGPAGLCIMELDVTGIKPGNGLLTRDFSVEQNFSNPFYPNSNIHLNIPGPAGALKEISLGIYNLEGQLMRSLYMGNKPAGNYYVIWDGRNNAGTLMPSGLYFSNLKIGNELQDTRGIILRR
jgi:hypothetical protein